MILILSARCMEMVGISQIRGPHDGGYPKSSGFLMDQFLPLCMVETSVFFFGGRYLLSDLGFHSSLEVRNWLCPIPCTPPKVGYLTLQRMEVTNLRHIFRREEATFDTFFFLGEICHSSNRLVATNPSQFRLWGSAPLQRTDLKVLHFH